MINDDKIVGGVAFLDILGMSSYMKAKYKNQPEYIRDFIIGKMITSCITALNHVQHEFKYDNNPSKLEWLFYADTMIIYLPIKKGSSINSINDVIETLAYCCNIVFASCLYQNIALRGAISYGEFLVSKDPVYIIGKPISDAYELESDQEWAGVAICEDLEVKILNRDLKLSYLTKADVPLKKRNSKNMYCINWPVFIAGAFNNVTNGKVYKLPNWDECFNSTKENVKIKKKNTVSFFEQKKTSSPPNLLVHEHSYDNMGDWNELYNMYKKI